jgi:hypothetical protein
VYFLDGDLGRSLDCLAAVPASIGDVCEWLAAGVNPQWTESAARAKAEQGETRH